MWNKSFVDWSHWGSIWTSRVTSCTTRPYTSPCDPCTFLTSASWARAFGLIRDSQIFTKGLRKGKKPSPCPLRSHSFYLLIYPLLNILWLISSLGWRIFKHIFIFHEPSMNLDHQSDAYGNWDLLPEKAGQICFWWRKTEIRAFSFQSRLQFLP